MQDDYPFKYMSSWHEGRLCGFNNFMGDRSYSISAYLSEYLKTHIEQENRHILLNLNNIFLFRNQGYHPKVQLKQLEVVLLQFRK
jgi:hypothetical protein